MDRESKKEFFEDRMAGAVPWTDDIAFRRELTLQGATWPEFNLFPGLDPLPKNFKFQNSRVDALHWVLSGRKTEKNYIAKSEGGNFAYVNRILPRGETLAIYEHVYNYDPDDDPLPGSMIDDEDEDPWDDEVEYEDDEFTVHGNVMFDAPVTISVLLEGGRLWMSNTPMERMTQRIAIQEASGVVAVGGLGLGWMLTEIANRESVTAVVLVEKSKELCDFILPRICERIPKDKPVYVVIGDIFEVLPEIHADKAALDIWEPYTEVEDEVRELMKKCPSVQSYWAWGKDFEGGYRRNTWAKKI